MQLKTQKIEKLKYFVLFFVILRLVSACLDTALTRTGGLGFPARGGCAYGAEPIAYSGATTRT